MAQAAPILKMRGICKSFPGVRALHEVDFSLNAGEIHALMGISTVYQEVNLCPALSVAENIYIGREPMRLGRINWKEINKKAAQALNRLNLDIDVTRVLSSYSVAIQQMVAIARAIAAPTVIRSLLH